MKRFLVFISLHLFLFLLVIAYQAQASEWTIDKYKTLTFARVSGEVTHGDNLNFWIRAEDDCAKVYNTFTVYTYEKPGDIKQLLNKNIPIKINDMNQLLQNKTKGWTTFDLWECTIMDITKIQLELERIIHLSENLIDPHCNENFSQNVCHQKI